MRHSHCVLSTVFPYCCSIWLSCCDLSLSGVIYCIIFFFFFFFLFFFQAEDGIRDSDMWLEFRRVLFRSGLFYLTTLFQYLWLGIQYAWKKINDDVAWIMLSSHWCCLQQYMVHHFLVICSSTCWVLVKCFSMQPLARFLVFAAFPSFLELMTSDYTYQAPSMH